MNDVSVTVNHDVAIVTVLDLEDVTRNRVRRHRLDEVEPGFLERDGVLAPILRDEEVKKVIDFGPTHFISRSRVRNNVNDTALYSVSQGV